MLNRRSFLNRLLAGATAAVVLPIVRLRDVVKTPTILKTPKIDEYYQVSYGFEVVSDIKNENGNFTFKCVLMDRVNKITTEDGVITKIEILKGATIA